MGAIPITSRHIDSALNETAGLWDLGPAPRDGLIGKNEAWLAEWVEQKSMWHGHSLMHFLELGTATKELLAMVSLKGPRVTCGLGLVTFSYLGNEEKKTDPLHWEAWPPLTQVLTCCTDTVTARVAFAM